MAMLSLSQGSLLCLSVPLNMFLAALVVAYWRGLWYILDEKLAPHNKELSGWLCVSLAFASTSLCLGIFQLSQRCRGYLAHSPVRWRLIELLYTHATAAASVFAWRGAWVLFDVYFYPNDIFTSGWGSFLIGVVLLSLMSSMRSTVAPPMAAAYDGNPRESIAFPPLHPWLASFLKKEAHSNNIGAAKAIHGQDRNPDEINKYRGSHEAKLSSATSVAELSRIPNNLSS